VSDPTGSVARPLRILARSGSVADDRRAILAAAAETGAGLIVVGLPRSLSGAEGPAARGAREEVKALQNEAGIEVTMHDERLTTVIARQSQPRRRRRRREPVDDVAAAVMLQSYLDSPRG
jgi:putative holliday junction resolvase